MVVVVFQMGKVASTAIAGALKRQGIDAPQAHIAAPQRLGRKLHVMANPGLSEPVAHQVFSDFAQELRVMYLLARRHAALERGEPPLAVITPVRDPLDWYWSHFAQMHEHYAEQLQRYHQADGGRAADFKLEHSFLRLMEEMFGLLEGFRLPLGQISSVKALRAEAAKRDSSNVLAAQLDRFLVPLRWFNEDFLPATSVNIYRHPFDVKAGASRIRAEGLEILLLQYERLASLESELASFVGVPRLVLSRENVSEEKALPLDMERMRRLGMDMMSQRLKKRIYNSRYARHFGYTGPFEAASQCGP